MDPMFLDCRTDELTEALPQRRGVGLRDKLWDRGQTITVELIGGTPIMHYYVQRFAEALRANVNFVWAIRPASGTATLPHEPAMIRCTFVEGDGSWSYIGTDATLIPAPQPTMNYGWMRYALEQKYIFEIERVVKHEFMHALGMVHEQEHPDCPIVINNAGYAHFAETAGWTREQVQRVYEYRYPSEAVCCTPYDKTSLMHYAIDGEHVVGGVGVPHNMIESAGDIAWLELNYGLLPVPPPPPKPEPKSKIFIPFVAN